MFLEWLKGTIKEHKLTRGQVAELCECSKSCVDKWLAGETVPKVIYLWKLCNRLYNCPQSESEYLIASKALGGFPCGHMYGPTAYPENPSN
jgi:transcriptional regulator with XRE-family HTH domain